MSFCFIHAPMLRNNMDVHIGGLFEEVLNGPVVKVFAEAMDRAAAKDNVRNALLAHEARSGVRDASSFDGEDLGIEIARELQIGG